jgi:tRNA A37 methylthiotransferase MiaB
MAKLYLRTFGCQMNEYDSEKIADVLREAEGLEPAARPEDADVIVFNTCSVREKAQEKLFADLGKTRPDDRGRRLRGKPGRSGRHRARALRGRGVRAADPAPAA